MDMPSGTQSPPNNSHRIKSAILEFLDGRLKPKLEELDKSEKQAKPENLESVKEKNAEARSTLLDQYQLKNWIADAARRVGQIQQVTHAIKFSHPDARGSSLSTTGNKQAGKLEIGTHTLSELPPPDVVGNAAALDVYKFLRITVDGRSLLELAIERAPDLAAVISENADEAGSWMAALATLPEPKGELSSHTLAKQLYWPLQNDQYHVLAPLFPTSLAHVVWRKIQEDRFSEEAKAARDASRNKRPHPHGYCEYPDLVVQSFGGTKPQNISQLNSERGGKNLLLPSLPPVWKSEVVRPPLHVESVFTRRFGNRFSVKQITTTLREFLKDVADVDSTVRIRKKRSELVDHIRDELFQYAAEIHELKPGWSLLQECRLNAAEKYWLDPGRSAQDEGFAAQYQRGDWQNEICLRFGNWLNAAIGTKDTPMGQAEASAWQSVIAAELAKIRLELSDHD